MSQAEKLLTELLELHDLERKQLANDYDSVRRIRQQSGATWERVRTLLYGEPPPAAKPVSPAEAERWRKRSEQVAADRKRRAENAAQQSND